MGKQDMPKGEQGKKELKKAPWTPEQYSSAMERAKQEAENRPENLEKLRKKVTELFPNPEQAKLREEIESSFDVPQMGEYHNEGVFMETHLTSILKNVEAVADGSYIWPPEVPKEIQDLLQETIKGNIELLERYTLLHDISKNDTLRLMTHEQTDAGIKEDSQDCSNAEWQAMAPEDVRRDPVKLLEFMQGNGKKKIVSISYYRKEGNHGKLGVEKISHLGGLEPDTEDNRLLLSAIGNHELALTFNDQKDKEGKVIPNSGIDLEKYATNLSETNEQGLRFALAVNFLDVSSSLQFDQKPNLSGFMNLLESKRNYEAYFRIKEMLSSNAGLEKKKVEAQLNKILKGKKPVDEKTELSRLEKECRPTEYGPGKLNEMLQELVGKNTLTTEEASEVAALILADNQPELGKKYGKKMGQIRAVMTASEKKD